MGRMFDVLTPTDTPPGRFSPPVDPTPAPSEPPAPSPTLFEPDDDTENADVPFIEIGATPRTRPAPAPATVLVPPRPPLVEPPPAGEVLAFRFQLLAAYHGPASPERYAPE